MTEAPAQQHHRHGSAVPSAQRMRKRSASGILRGNPLNVSMVPLAGAERMALLRMRKAKGESGSPPCRSCGKRYRLDVASFQRLEAGLCASCWRKTPEGEEERRAADRRRYQSNEDRKAATAAAVARHRERLRAEGRSISEIAAALRLRKGTTHRMRQGMAQ
jgi:hypothetical protein